MSIIVLPALSAWAGPDPCIPQKGLFGNYQSRTEKATVSSKPFLNKSGGEVSLGDYKGKGVVLNFWATWCAPCVREMPQLDRLSAFVRENGIDVLTVSEDRNGLKSVPGFYKRLKLRDLPILVDPKGQLMRSFAVSALPLTVLINADGQEVGRVIGPAEWDSVEITDFIRQCLSPKG